MEEHKKIEPMATEHLVAGNTSTHGEQPKIAPSAASEKLSLAAEKAQRIPGWKRTLDLTFLLLSLPCWLLVMVLVALWLKVVSPGPVFYRQQRVGYRGRIFTMLKFRSMKVNVETKTHERYLEQLMRSNCPMTKLDAFGDNRLVPGGRLLRASGLDELPQLLNVIFGEMSLVGPRPCTPHEFEKFAVCQQARVNAPPGLTGYWQVNGKNKTTFGEMITLDLFYAQHMSLWLDLSIMLKTGSAIVAQLLEARAEYRRQARSEKISVEQ